MENLVRAGQPQLVEKAPLTPQQVVGTSGDFGGFPLI